MNATTGNSDFAELMRKLEPMGIIEYANCSGDAVHVLLKLPVRCVCRETHHWYVNRDGKTRCIGCDEKYLRERTRSQLSRSSERPAEASVA